MADKPQLWALIWHDTHVDPEVIVGTEEQVQRELVRRTVEYLRSHPWPEHQTAGRALAAKHDLAEAVEACFEYLGERVEYIQTWIVEASRPD
jgi:hypothetical protein